MDYNSIIEGTVKFRDGKKWKSRWCVMRKLSPVADCLHLQLYRDSKDRYKQGQTKASLSLQHFLGIETGFTLDKESNTIAILCQDVTVVLAFDTRERLIQWQVKIANNLGEDQQYLIQIASAPGKTKIAPGPARIHLREFRFCLTAGVPPRLMGLWDIRHLRRYGVVDGRFCFEGGSRCGRGEGLYIIVSDQGEDISKAFRLASEGKLAPKRKNVSRNMSVMESPRRMLQQRMMSQTDTGCETVSSLAAKQEIRSSWEGTDYGDTASVCEAPDEQEGTGWTGEVGIGRCCSCISKLATLTSLPPPLTSLPDQTVKCTQKEGTTLCNASVVSQASSDSHTNSDSSSGCDCRSTAVSPCRQVYHYTHCRNCPDHSTCSCSVKSTSQLMACQIPILYENYDIPRTLIPKLQDIKTEKGSKNLETLEYYDTPKKIKEHLSQQSSVEEVNQKDIHTHHSCCSIHHCISRSICDHIISSCQRVCQKTIQTSICCSEEIRIQSCLCSNQANSYINNGVIYAKVDMQKKTKKNMGEVSTEEAKCTSNQNDANFTVVNYENLGFAQSLEHYENVKDLASRIKYTRKACEKCPCHNVIEENARAGDQDDYLLMGPIDEGKASVPPYISMNPSMAAPQCCQLEGSKSAASSPFMRRPIRRRSNSVDSGRRFRGLDCISERTASSTHNTVTANSATGSVESLPAEEVRVVEEVVKSDTGPLPASPAPKQPELRRPNNRDSSSSNDSGVSITSLKQTEPDPAIPPPPMWRHIRSKSSDPLQDLSFRFEKRGPSPEQKQPSSGSSSSGGLTIPYMDSISTSSGTSDMSDYIDTLSMSSYSSSDAAENLRLCHSAVTILRPRSGKEYQKIDRYNISEDAGKASKKIPVTQHSDSPSLGYLSSTSSN